MSWANWPAEDVSINNTVWPGTFPAQERAQELPCHWGAAVTHAFLGGIKKARAAGTHFQYETSMKGFT